MPLRPAHEYRIKPGSRIIEMVRENPIVRFHVQRDVRVGMDRNGNAITDQNPAFHPPILYQDGGFYYEDGEEIPKKNVPKYILEQLRTHPPPKPQVLGAREIRMTLEEAERAFGDPGLDTRIAAREAAAVERERHELTAQGHEIPKRGNGRRRRRRARR